MSEIKESLSSFIFQRILFYYDMTGIYISESNKKIPTFAK